MLMILKSCIPQTYYKKHVHDMIFKKNVQIFHLAFQASWAVLLSSIVGKQVGSAIKTKIMEHTDGNCLEAAWLLQQEILPLNLLEPCQ